MTRFCNTDGQFLKVEGSLPMTGFLMDKTGATVLALGIIATVWHNGSYHATKHGLCDLRDIMATVCLLNMLAFMHAAITADTSRWQWPWSLSGRGGPPSNAWPRLDRQRFLGVCPFETRDRTRAGRGRGYSSVYAHGLCDVY